MLVVWTCGWCPLCAWPHWTKIINSSRNTTMWCLSYSVRPRWIDHQILKTQPAVCHPFLSQIKFSVPYQRKVNPNSEYLYSIISTIEPNFPFNIFSQLSLKLLSFPSNWYVQEPQGLLCTFLAPYFCTFCSLGLICFSLLHSLPPLFSSPDFSLEIQRHNQTLMSCSWGEGWI